jgi:hypothetical protein
VFHSFHTVPVRRQCSLHISSPLMHVPRNPSYFKHSCPYSSHRHVTTVWKNRSILNADDDIPPKRANISRRDSYAHLHRAVVVFTSPRNYKLHQNRLLTWLEATRSTSWFDGPSLLHGTTISHHHIPALHNSRFVQSIRFSSHLSTQLPTALPFGRKR